MTKPVGFSATPEITPPHIFQMHASLAANDITREKFLLSPGASSFKLKYVGDGISVETSELDATMGDFELRVIIREMFVSALEKNPSSYISMLGPGAERLLVSSVAEGFEIVFDGPSLVAERQFSIVLMNATDTATLTRTLASSAHFGGSFTLRLGVADVDVAFPALTDTEAWVAGTWCEELRLNSDSGSARVL